MTENRLSRETSPYLLQHQENPVHWWAWGPEALAEAKQSGKPILLSVGYAACHWCHVMAHESFEDAATAAVMNDLFVNIKVDREERPDIDAVYMAALHRTGEHGGWPMTMFLDTDARPFWGGTYFPPTARWGKPAFVDVLKTVARVFHAEPDRVAATAEQLTRLIATREAERNGPVVTDALLADLTSRMVRAVDTVRGGIAGAPKFPQWNFFWLLWRGAIRYGHEPAKAAVVKTLTHICQGGIYDHLGGGFARYSVDERWLAPHFEKMLYDNALLIDLLTEVWRETHDPLFKARIAETAAWVLREMVAEGGGFAASLDADSEGEEGKFYVWAEAEIVEVLGVADATFFASAYDVTAEGNWEGHTILNRLGELDGVPSSGVGGSPPPNLPRKGGGTASREGLADPPSREGEPDISLLDAVPPPLRGRLGGGEPPTPEDGNPHDSTDDKEQATGPDSLGSDPTAREQRLASLRAKLLAQRDKRIRPGWDDKVLADWNGLMIAALVRAAQVFAEPAWLAAAARAFAFVTDRMMENGRLSHSFRQARANAPATASDYANMIWAALRLYQATLNDSYLAHAKDWTAVLDRHYWQEGAGGYATTADDTTDVIARLVTASDDAAPSANAIMVSNLAALASLTGDGQYVDRAAAILRAFAGDIGQFPVSHSGLLASAMDVLAPQQIAILGGSAEGGQGLTDALHGMSVPGALEFVIADAGGAPASPALAGKTAKNDRATAYVCLGPRCSLPVTDSNDLKNVLTENRQIKGSGGL